MATVIRRGRLEVCSSCESLLNLYCPCLASGIAKDSDRGLGVVMCGTSWVSKLVPAGGVGGAGGLVTDMMEGGGM